MRECSAGASLATSLDIIRQRNVRAIVIEEGTYVQQVVDVESKRLEIAGQLSGTVDVAGNDVKSRNPRFAERLLSDAARHFVEISADQDERTLVERRAASSEVLNYKIEM